jgi:hypothetical protein
VFGQADAHDAGAHAGNDGGMPDGTVPVFTQVASHPGNALAAHDVVRIDHLVDAGYGCDMAADHNRRVRRKLADHAAHFTHFGDVHDDRGDSDDVVWMRGDLALEIVSSREIKNGAGRGIFAWISIMPQERWNMRSEKLPCARVT